jgi:hypothetical protein
MVTHTLGNRIRYQMVSHMTPPDDDIGVREYLLGQTAFGIIKGDSTDLKLFTSKVFSQRTVDTVGVHLRNALFYFLVDKFVINGDTKHRISPPQA